MPKQPWQIMQDWIEGRIDDIVGSHAWHTKKDNPLYLWTLAVKNHHIPPLTTDHYSEPPIPPPIGYLAQIALKPVGVADQVDVGLAQSHAIGTAAMLQHGLPQLPGTPNHNSTTFDPVAILKEWIKGRIKHAADQGHSNAPLWSADLTAWTQCIASDPPKYPPSALALGYMVHAACNLNAIADPDSTLGAIALTNMGVSISILDGRGAPLMQGCSNAELDISKSPWGRNGDTINTIPAPRKA